MLCATILHVLVFALPPTGTPDDLARLFGGVDNFITPRQVESVVSDPVGALLAIANDEQLSAYVRGRATTMLGRFGEDRSRDGLLTLATHGDARLRLQAVKGLKNLIRYGLQRFAGDSAVAASLATCLHDADTSVRLHAVSGLALLPSASAALSAHLQREQDPRVRDLIAATLRQGLGQ